MWFQYSSSEMYNQKNILDIEKKDTTEFSA